MPKRSKTKKECPVVYPEIEQRLCVGEEALTAEGAKQLLGWQEVTDGDYLLIDENKNKVQCVHNVGNSPFRRSRMLRYAQDILRRRWQINCHNRIIGKYGSVLSGQHVLVALVIAEQMWRNDPEKWGQYWATEPTIETLIALGADETDSVKQTIDTGREKNLTDILCRSPYFVFRKSKDKVKLAKICDHAVRLLWQRTGAVADAWAPARTHSEALEFVRRHPKVITAVEHVYIEDGETEKDEDGKRGGHKLSRRLNLGHAAAMLYLMGVSGSEPEKYRSAMEPTEADLDTSLWEMAEQFFTDLASDSKNVKHVITALDRRDDLECVTATWRIKVAILARAWEPYSAGNPIVISRFRLKYVESHGVRRLAESPTVGGIDCGDSPPTPILPESRLDPLKRVFNPMENDKKEPSTPKPKKSETKKPAKQKPQNKKPKTENQKPKPQNQKPKRKKLEPSRHGDEWSKGDVAWVLDNGDPYLGTLLGDPFDCSDGLRRVFVTHATDRKDYEVAEEDLRLVLPRIHRQVEKSG